MQGKLWMLAGAMILIIGVGAMVARISPATWTGYDDAWKTVDSLDAIMLPESALKAVEEIYAHARDEKNDPQLVKSLIYKAKYSEQLNENGTEKAIALFENEIKISSGVQKSVLQSLTAELYWQYYTNNRWKFSQRTQTEEILSDDIATWDIPTLHNKVHALYEASISQRELLKKTSVKDYKAILLDGNIYGQFLRPTMFDVLGQRALEFFRNNESTLTQPATAVNIKDPILLASAKQFAGYTFAAADSNIIQLPAIRILQDLTTAHLYDPYPEAIIDLNLQRYDYALGVLSISNSDSIFLQALERDEKQYARDSASARISARIAQWHIGKAAGYQPLESDAYKWELRTAKEYLTKAITAFPTSMGAQICRGELSRIEEEEIEDLSVERVQAPDVPTLASVAYRNIDKIYFQLLKATPEQIDEISSLDYEDKWTAIQKLKVERKWEQPLPTDGDMQSHRVECKIEPLSLGSYFLIAGKKEKWVKDSSLYIVKEIFVSNMAYIAGGSSDQEEVKQFYVIDRSTGQPMKGVEVNTFRKEYDYTWRKYNRHNLQKYVTDANGMFEVRDPLIRDYYYFGFRLTKGKDVMESESGYYIAKHYAQPERDYVNTILFTDRAIYRPGQTIYFKGVMYSNTDDGKTKTVLADRSTTVRFYDVNYQQVASVDLVTNNYGSFAGSFTAPANGLTGNMRIQNETGSVYFSVEEYKRPTFSVSIDALTGDYILNESIPVTGVATAYSGAVIDNAIVRYRVVRSARIPYWYDDFYSRKISYPYSGGDVEVASGTINTDGEGKFVIPFKAIADIDKQDEARQFDFTIYADVTDVSGETRSAGTSVSIGTFSLSLTAGVESTYNNMETAYGRIYTNNLNGQHLDVQGTVTIHRLEAPDKLLRARTWQRPDLYLMSEPEFRKSFPHDEYANELDPASWKMGAAVASAKWNSAISDSVALPLTGLRQGMYRVIYEAKDKSGIMIRSEHMISVLDKGSYTAYPTYFMQGKNADAVQPGEDAIIQIGSSAHDVSALVTIRRSDGSSVTKWVNLAESAGRKSGGSMMDIAIPVTEADRGGIATQVVMMKDGRDYSATYPIPVPWTNKDLQVKLETYRDKLQPGVKETWKITITGDKSEKVNAELLASMYDASLDAFKQHGWDGIYYPNISFYPNLTVGGTGLSSGWYFTYVNSNYYYIPEVQYNTINWFGYSLNMYYWGFLDAGNVSLEEVAIKSNKGLHLMGSRGDAGGSEDISAAIQLGEQEVSNYFVGLDDKTSKEKDDELIPGRLTQVPVRTNFNETAFFYPQLQTDSNGAISFSFTMPEALTTWKFMAFAHTPDLKTGTTFASVITQKDLMAQPNMPRFLRAGDKITLTAKISNLTDKAINGTAQLELLNAMNMQPVNNAFANTTPIVSFSANAKGSTVAQWDISVPEGIDAIVYRVKAGNENISDGEENGLPVLTNKILVTESLPLWVRGDQPKVFSFDKLLKSGNSNTLRSQSVTLEYTSNPAWYAVQALPYMMEYPYECAEQVFSRYYANSIAAHIANSDPEIRRVFDGWKNNPSSLTSNLEKNQELKSLMLEETPWVLQAQSETERKKRVALLFDVNRMQSEQLAALKKLQKMQLPNGGWPWFSGYKDDRYITQYIVTGLAHLEQLGVNDAAYTSEVNNMLNSAMPYCTARMREDYVYILKNGGLYEKYVPSNITLQYLYAASYFEGGRFELSKEEKEAKAYFIGQVKTYWTGYSLYERGLIAIILQRNGEEATAQAIVKSLRETSIRSDEMGMYWKDNTAGYFWYQAPIETQALMIEVFGEVANDNEAVDALQIWLLRQKQTTDWKTTRATAEACYALLSRGQNLLASKDLAIITVGKLVVQPEKTELGTGYFKTNWLGTNINPEMGKISITPPANNLLSYGAMYWQYFEDMDKVTSAQTNLQLKKQLFVEVNSSTGPKLKQIDENTVLHVGDKVVVRIELISDRDMEYVHMKDMRASGFEPVNVLSTYKWQDGLGYYEATGDASTNFFIAYLRKGTYVFEYPVHVSHKGNMSNGITTIQCMYAPEFTSHSEGVKVVVQ